MEILRNFGSIPIYVAEAEKPLLDKALTSGQVLGDEIDLHYVKDQETIDVAGHKGTVIATPGHTPGSVCYRFGNFLFTGDTLLCNGVGSCDDANLAQLKQSVREKLFVLPRETTILPGHGEFSAIATESLFNPVVGKDAK
ncbi:hypothetical protein WA538_003733, partial [Blastocystis sp. DL]